MNPLSELSLSCRTDWLDHIPGEAVVYLLFVVVNCYDRVRQVSNIAEHVDWIFQGHKVVVHLVKPVSIVDYLPEKGWE